MTSGLRSTVTSCDERNKSDKKATASFGLSLRLLRCGGQVCLDQRLVLAACGGDVRRDRLVCNQFVEQSTSPKAPTLRAGVLVAGAKDYAGASSDSAIPRPISPSKGSLMVWRSCSGKWDSSGRAHFHRFAQGSRLDEVVLRLPEPMLARSWPLTGRAAGHLESWTVCGRALVLGGTNRVRSGSSAGYVDAASALRSCCGKR
jgi:hypothetical protein